MSLNLDAVRSATFIDVGGCGFKSIAVWLLDYIEHGQDPWLKGPWFNIIWDDLCAAKATYCQTIARQSLPVKKIQQILLSDSRAQIVPIVTQTLVNMACEELCNYPVRYRDFLFSNNKWSINEQSVTSNLMYMVALARSMCLSLSILSCLQQTKTHQLIHCKAKSAEQCKSPLVLRHDVGDYFKVLMPQRDWLSTVLGYGNLTMPDECAATLAWVQAKMLEDEKLLLKRYDSACLKMINQWVHGSLNKDQATSLYIKMLADNTNFSIYRTKSEMYFDYLQHKHQYQPLTEWRKVRDNFVQQLIQATARLMVL